MGSNITYSNELPQKEGEEKSLKFEKEFEREKRGVT
jgi:hypothetical protein